MRVGAPKPVDFSPERLKRVDVAMERYVSDGRLAGLITTVGRSDRVIHKTCHGMMDIEAGKSMQLDTIFRIASMTKPVTSVAVMLLYEEGHLDLHTPVHEFIPAFKDAKVLQEMTAQGPKLVDADRPITISHLMTHSAGLSYGWDRNDPVDQLYQEARREFAEQNPAPNLAESVELVAALPLAFQPGTSWRYSFAIDVLGRVVEVVSGLPLDVFFAQRIFEPLGMIDTGFYAPVDKASRLAVLYEHRSGELTPAAPQAELRGREKPSWFSGGGGLVSTITDYARFARMLACGGSLDDVQLLSPTTMALYSMNHASDEALQEYWRLTDRHGGYGYSLGVQVLMDVAASGRAGSVGEFGWGGAFSTYFWVDPVLALYGVLMAQFTPNNAYPIAGQFKQLTYQAIIG